MRWGQARNLWDKWDAAVREGRQPQDFLDEVSDESLIQLLLVCPADKERARDTVATHLWNRLRWSRRTLDEVTREAGDSVQAVTEELEAAVPVVHRLERFGIRAERTPSGAEVPAELDPHDASLLIEAVKAAHDKARDALKRLERFRDARVSKGRDEPE